MDDLISTTQVSVRKYISFEIKKYILVRYARVMTNATQLIAMCKIKTICETIDFVTYVWSR